MLSGVFGSGGIGWCVLPTMRKTLFYNDDNYTNVTTMPRYMKQQRRIIILNVSYMSDNQHMKKNTSRGIRHMQVCNQWYRNDFFFYSRSFARRGSLHDYFSLHKHFLDLTHWSFMKLISNYKNYLCNFSIQKQSLNLN